MTKSSTLPELGNVIYSRANSTYSSLNGNESSTAVQHDLTELLEALDELRALVLGPRSYIYYTLILSPSRTAIFNVLYKYNIAHHVPIESKISYTELPKLCGLNEHDTRRIIRAAISLRFFEEQPIGFVGHNATSAVLATSRAHDSLGFFTEEFMPAALKLPESLGRYPGSEKPGESAIAIANGSVGDQDIFSIISSDRKRVDRFANAMSFGTTVAETSLSHFIDNVAWSPNHGAQQQPKVVVDVGGSRGDLCVALLRKYGDIEKAIVQDLPGASKKNQEGPFPEDVAGRISYQAYDFFTQQTVQDADLIIFRTVLHDWPTNYAVRILRNQIPALKQGARSLINDICIESSAGGNSHIHEAQHAHDLFVKMGMNSAERTKEDWIALLSTADERFVIQSIVMLPQSVYSIIEVVWQGTLDKVA